MVTMGRKDFINYLDKLAKKFHKDYSCVLISSCKRENLYELVINLLKAPEERIRATLPAIISGGGGYEYSIYGAYPKLNPIRIKKFKFIAPEYDLSLDFGNFDQTLSVRYSSRENYCFFEVDTITFNPDFIEHSMKKFIFDMEMEDNEIN